MAGLMSIGCPHQMTDSFLFCVAGSRKGSEVPHLPSDPPSAADEVHVRPTDRPKHQDQ